MARFGVMRLKLTQLKGLILAQNERWRRGLGMQVVREVLCLQRADSGERESNAWVIYLQAWDSGGKLPVIPDNVSGPKVRFRRGMSPRPISLLVG